MKFQSLALLSLLPLVIASSSQATPRDWYVATNGTSSAGTNWENAYTNLHWVLANLGNGDTVYLAGHTFPLTNQLAWTATEGLTLRGGYAATNSADTPGPSDPELWPTVLTRASLAVNHRILQIQGVTNGTLEAITITGGNAPIATFGGGVRVDQSTNLWIKGCIVSENTALGSENNNTRGGGLYLSLSSVTISNSQIRLNRAHNPQGGNSTAEGGGIYQVGGVLTLRDSVIAYNEAFRATRIDRQDGAGIYNSGGVLNLHNCLIAGNVVTKDGIGGGVFVTGAAAQARLESCTVAYNLGAGIHQAGGATVTVTNSMVWGNTAATGGSVAFGFSNQENAGLDGVNGNVSTDPLFERGFYLAAGSPCLAAGTNTVADAGLAGYTSLADGTTYAGRINMGYHYPTGLDPAYADLHVAPDGDDNAAGTSWGTAFRSLTRAVAVARHGTTIRVAEGQYTNTVETFPVTLNGVSGIRILGEGTDTVINATNSSQRVISLTKVSLVELADLTIIGGNAPNNTQGGGVLIWRAAGISITNCMIAGNTARAAENHNAFGGGLYAEYSDVRVSDCEISENRCHNTQAGNADARGGGIYLVAGRMEVRNSVVANNVVFRNSNNLRQNGGGIANDSGSLLMRNCLITGNVASKEGVGGGLYLTGTAGVTQLENCTVANNSGAGGIHNVNSVLSVTNSIIWGHLGDLSGAVEMGYSNSGDESLAGVNGNLSANPLFDNGFYLAEGSPCIGTGTNTVAHWGLEGYTTSADGTPYSGRVNMGYHYPSGADQSFANLFVSTTGSDANSGTNWPEAFRTVTKALQTARNGSVIQIAAGDYTADLEAYPLTLTGLSSVKLIGDENGVTRLDATNSNHRVMQISNTGAIELRNLTLTGGNAPVGTHGGALHVSDTVGLLIENCSLTGNTARATENHNAFGGGLFATASSVEVNRSLISANRCFNTQKGNCDSRGGGIYLSLGSMLVRDSIIDNNRAIRQGDALRQEGGGIYNAGGGLTLRNCLITRNHAVAGGGGLGLSGATVLQNCTIADNTGEGIKRSAGTVSVTNSIVWNNGVDIVGDIQIGYSLIGDEIYADIDGNISIDPLFVDAAGGDYRLSNGSPAANKGIKQAWMTSEATDLAGNLRIQAGKVDMGAYESSMGSGTLFIFR